mgnify:CR=1 FL=1
MIRLLEHGLCTGCGACAAACPMGAIRMEEQGGFPFPAVGQNCTDCGKCMQVCGRRILSKSAAPLAAWRLNSRDTALRFKSSSGGFFGEAARLILSEGGCVFGAAWGEGCFSVSHRKAESPGELEASPCGPCPAGRSPADAASPCAARWSYRVSLFRAYRLFLLVSGWGFA